MQLITGVHGMLQHWKTKLRDLTMGARTTRAYIPAIVSQNQSKSMTTLPVWKSSKVGRKKQTK